MHASLVLLCAFFVVAESASLSCLPRYSADEIAHLKTLTDTRTVTDITDVASRLREIAHMLGKKSDPRGTFTVVYSVMATEAAKSVQDGMYANTPLANELIIVFANTYLNNYHRYLSGLSTQAHWGVFFRLAEECSSDALRLAASGINSHITIDLAEAVATVGAPRQFQDDFRLLGDVLMREYSAMVSQLKHYYGVDSSDFFSGFVLGKWIDRFAGTGATTTFVFQTVRTEAWVNGRLLQKPIIKFGTQAAMKTTFYTRELLLATLETFGLLH